MDRPKTWKCDSKGCSENAEYYREVKGYKLKLCLRHEVMMRRQRKGKPLDYSELNADDIRHLEEKDAGRNDFKCPKCGLWVIVTDKELNDVDGYECRHCRVPMTRSESPHS